MIFFLTHWKLIVGMAAGLVIGAIVSTPFHRHAGRQALLAEQATAAANIERERVKNDAALRNLSDRALCERALGARGLPHDCGGLL